MRFKSYLLPSGLPDELRLNCTVASWDHALNGIDSVCAEVLTIFNAAEAWVTKGPNSVKVPDYKARGQFGIRVHPHSRLHVLLKEGKTLEQRTKDERERKLKRVVSAGIVREDKPLRNPGSMWAW